MLAKKGYVWAVDTQNNEMAFLFDITKSTFHHVVESIALAQVKNIRNAINANVGNMSSVNMNSTDEADLDAAIAAYVNTVGTTGAMQSNIATGTQAIEALMHPIDASLDIIEKLTLAQYSDTHVDMVKEFLLNRHIDSLPTHHSGVHVHVTDFATQANLQGAILSIDGTGKTSTTDINGIAEIIKVKNGDYNVTISLAGYISQTIQVAILRGKVTALDVALKK